MSLCRTLKGETKLAYRNLLRSRTAGIPLPGASQTTGEFDSAGIRLCMPILWTSILLSSIDNTTGVDGRGEAS